VRLPILLRTGEKDEITPIEHAHKIINGVADPALVEHQDIPGAGHFAFMSKFPPEMTRRISSPHKTRRASTAKASSPPSSPT
jgi:pimeloyl-ACP methyl ester carboxylesterase